MKFQKLHQLKFSWRKLIAADIAFKLILFLVLTPVISLMFRFFVELSGRTVLADTDIAIFLIHPLGWLALIIVGSAFVCTLALEQAVLMTLCLCAFHGLQLNVWESLRSVLHHATGIYRITALMLIRLLGIVLPFLASGGFLFWYFLTDHDINYYLTKKPLPFWYAVFSIGPVLLIMLLLVLRSLVNWSFAFPLHLFEHVAAADCLRISQQRTHGHKGKIARGIVLWAVGNFLISAILTAVTVTLGSLIVPEYVDSIWWLAITLGFVLSIWTLVNFITNLLANISFAVLLSYLYDSYGRSEAFTLPEDSGHQFSWEIRWTRRRLAAAFVIASLLATTIGITAIHTVRLEDDVEITAHRGGAFKAPENTLAAIRQGIADGADWIEIDVQESKDGVVLVAHDNDLMKVAGSPLKIWQGTAAELQAIDIGSYFSADYASERVPTLDEVLKLCKGKARLNIELKYYGHTQNLEQKVVELVESNGMENHIVIMSLKMNGIRKIQKLRPDWTVGLLTAVAAGDLTRSDVDFLAVSTKLAKRDFIHTAHRKGKAVYAWTVNDPVTMSTMIGRGVDNIITDDPEMAREVLEDRAEMSPVERVLIEFSYLFRRQEPKVIEQ
ncbi:glycerophosphodiester phosphodiesterase [Rubinisphaera italica]|uniref:Glycerophosphoryl diester phosphodiesterase n=1 Tax=Rubinisphaera italica TaxID=2527969 RepID=A0A5C5XG68_9PLAN|nr:glycerophosphodiester phosphodiesterase [Rubinisphaera italica]TWT61391.1 Glycerophosphoryl diester phosphodiesterase [Rubinisphaera italica]